MGPHHDEGPASLITTAALRRLTELTGGEPGGMDVDPLRFRANLLVDLAGSGFPEENWLGRPMRVGPEVVLRPVRQLTRCVMVDMAQDRAVERSDLLKTLAEHHGLTSGVLATVERPGRVTVGDACSWTGGQCRDSPARSARSQRAGPARTRECQGP
ncbi:MOSC domain-containing protein [Micromonospora sp. CPCC 206061]|uniref:MOSC domain-containing protein n=1 Tax=Micromonospora sp. CPCC 206061 TaxID=3122410 RepID=UPI002FF08902